MIMHLLQKFHHKIRAAILLAMISKIIKDMKVFLKDILICLTGEMDINLCTSTPFIDSTLDLIA
jgi:hypothetical protein